ncbi:MAG: hypothetical protein K9M45_12305 [Kiritimatiellales bacterium]|nr:hypothetical protein [Kiritimatiellales bacterium]
MNGSLSRRLFTAGVGCAAATAGARTRICEVCGRRLPRQSYVYAGKTVCSQECIDALRPKCSICGNIIRGNYIKADGKIYCGEACFRTTLPKCEICNQPVEQGFSITQHRYCANCVEKQPICFSCGLPGANPTRLKDGRDICNDCMRRAVKTQDAAQPHYEHALRQLEAWTSLTIATVPALVLIDRDEMRRLSKKIRQSNSPVSIRGLYSRQVMMSKRGLFGAWKEEPSLAQEKIYIVDHLSDEVFRVAATHELMHDLIHEHFPRLEEAPLWVQEGICQQATAEFCRRRNYSDTLHGIENCPDPDYGDGYRYIHGLSGFRGWAGLRRWMETVDVAALPETAIIMPAK